MIPACTLWTCCIGLENSNIIGRFHRIFNYHPLLMILAFPVVMGEALLAFRQPPMATQRYYGWWMCAPRPTHSPHTPSTTHRPSRKQAHWVLHTIAIVFALTGVLAAYRSHSLKLPVPTPNLYSVHSYLGLITVMAALVQYVLGFLAYLLPKLPLPKRRALMPAHQLMGRSVFVLGLATAAVCWFGVGDAILYAYVCKPSHNNRLGCRKRQRLCRCLPRRECTVRSWCCLASWCCCWW